MGAGRPQPVRARTFLQLGRPANLPTIWTNLMVGIALGGGAAFLPWWIIALLILAVSALYLGGTYLNDAVDAAIDARERPERPIPSGRIQRSTVLAASLALLAFGLLCIGFVAGSLPLERAYPLGIAGIALGVAIVGYDLMSKLILGPFLIAICRTLVYVIGALAVSPFLSDPLRLAAGFMFIYIVGVTFFARQENFTSVRDWWPALLLTLPLAYATALTLNSANNVSGLFLALLLGWAFWCSRMLTESSPKQAVGALIAGIALYDAAILAAHGFIGMAGLAVLLFGAAIVLQRALPAT